MNTSSAGVDLSRPKPQCEHLWRYADLPGFRYCLRPNCPQRQLLVDGEWQDERKAHFREIAE